MTIYIGASQEGYHLKEQMKAWFGEKGWHYVDLGSFNLHKVSDEETAREVAEKVLENKGSRGILFCGQGMTMSEMASKLPGIKMDHDHDDNVLCVSGKMSLEETKKVVENFLKP